jgi:hypothetical protein
MKNMDSKIMISNSINKRPISFWIILTLAFQDTVTGKVADRSRLVKHRQDTGRISSYHDNGRPIEGQSYRSNRIDNDEDVTRRVQADENLIITQKKQSVVKPAPWKMENTARSHHHKVDLPDTSVDETQTNTFLRLPQQEAEDFEHDLYHALFSSSSERELSSQLSGCCYTYKSYGAANLCSLYGNDCESGETPSHDSGDGECSQDGLSFIGLSFSVNTVSGNPYSYQLCDQFPMENIIDRNYHYSMSMDEDGWLVGGGYKTFDYSGKMP